MYSGTLRKQGFTPDPSSFQHADEREAYIRKLRESASSFPEPVSTSGGKEVAYGVTHPSEPKSLAQLLEMVSPEDSALISLIVFLLCDNTENDVVLLGILLYVLLSK